MLQNQGWIYLSVSMNPITHKLFVFSIVILGMNQVLLLLTRSF